MKPLETGKTCLCAQGQNGCSMVAMLPPTWVEVRTHWGHYCALVSIEESVCHPLDQGKLVMPECLDCLRRTGRARSDDVNFPFYGTDGLEFLEWFISFHRRPVL